MHNKHHSKQKGLFLSIEVLIIFILLSVLTVIVAMSVGNILKTWRIGQIVKEYATYSDAIQQFKSIYGYWPGDVPLEKMSGDLNHQNTINGIYSLEHDDEAIPQDNVFGNGMVVKSKSNFVFRQLALAGLINKQPINMSCNISPMNGDNVVGTGITCPVGLTNIDQAFIMTQPNRVPLLFPRSVVDLDGVVWVFMVYNPSIISSTTVNDMNFIYDKYATNNTLTTLAKMTNQWRDKPRLTLARGVNNSLSSQNPSIIPEIAMRVDLKVDDGRPSTANGNVVADGVQGQCTNATTRTTISDNDQYVANPLTKGCILSFKVGNRSDT